MFGVTFTSALYSMHCSVVVVVTVIRRIRTRSVRTRRIINILLRRIGITPGGRGE